MEKRRQRERFLKRVEELEERVFGVQNVDLKQGSNLNREAAYVRISNLLEKSQNIFAESFEEYLASYKKSPVYLQHSVEKQSPALHNLDSSEQLELLRVSATDIAKTVKQLEEIARLKEFINHDEYQNLGKLMDRMNALEPSFSALAARSVAVHDRVGHLTDHYDKMISLISEKIVQWDEALRGWEKQAPP